MAANLENTLSGMDVQTGYDELLQGLPPEALAAAQALLNVKSAPTSSDVERARANVEQAFAPVQQELAGKRAPTPLSVPPETTPFGTFLALLSANLAGQVAPGLEKPTYEQRARDIQQREDIEKLNLARGEQFRTQQTERGLALATSMAQAALEQAAQAGDDRAAAQKAMQLAKLNDALMRRRQREQIQTQGAETRMNITARNRERLQMTLELKKQLKDMVDELDLSPAGKLRLRAHIDFLGTYLTNATRVDQVTGESQMPLDAALRETQRQFDNYLNEQLKLEGKQTFEPSGTTTPSKGGSLLDRAAARLGQ